MEHLTAAVGYLGANQLSTAATGGSLCPSVPASGLGLPAASLPTAHLPLGGINRLGEQGLCTTECSTSSSYSGAWSILVKPLQLLEEQR